MSNASNDGGETTTRLDDWAAQLKDRVTAAARAAIEEGGSDPADPVSTEAPDLTTNLPTASHEQEIYESLAEGLAHFRQPDFSQYDPNEVITALGKVFPGKSGPPAEEWLTWLHRRVAALSGGMTTLQDDEHPVLPEHLLFRAYRGNLQGLLTNRQIVLTPAGVEFTS